MKKLLMSLLILALSLGVSCSNKADSNDTAKAEVKSEVKKDEIKTVKKGDIISSDSSEIKIKKIEFSYDVLPDDTSGIYNHYAAEKGKAYIHIDTDVKNVQKQELPCDKIMNVEVDYNNGYNYTGFAVVEDSNTGFTYANISSITPLETKGIRFLVEVPKEVAESKNPVSVVFELDGNKYKSTIR